MSERHIFIPGIPAPQGSKRHVGNGVMVESSKRLRPWRATVTAAVAEAGWEPIITGPVHLSCRFHFPRPKHHYGTGRNANTLKLNAPVWHATKPDLSKIVRAIEDALVDAGALRDDALIARASVEKVYCLSNAPGVDIAIRPLAVTQ